MSALSKEIERAVRSYQRALHTHERKHDIVRASGWDDDVLRRQREDLAWNNVKQARKRLERLLLAEVIF